jgi:hypothetical protein
MSSVVRRPWSWGAQKNVVGVYVCVVVVPLIFLCFTLFVVYHHRCHPWFEETQKGAHHNYTHTHTPKKRIAVLFVAWYDFAAE